MLTIAILDLKPLVYSHINVLESLRLHLIISPEISDSLDMEITEMKINIKYLEMTISLQKKQTLKHDVDILTMIIQ